MLRTVDFHGLDASPALREAVHAKLDKLEEHFSGLTGVNVVIESPHRHQQKGRNFHVRVEAHIPGLTVVSDQDGDRSHEDVYVALRDAVQATYRQLSDATDKRRSH